VSGRILAIDTTAEFGSLALAGEEVLLHAPDGFGSVIFEHIERLLQRLSLRLADLDGFAAASGPGSFTGVRIGLACVKGLAEATAKPAFGVSNLAALARFGSTARRVPVIDARRGEVYAAVYDASGRVIVAETVCPFPTFQALLPEGPVEFITRNEETPQALAAMIARIAEERLAAGDPGDPAALDANYVRRSDAELLFKPW
jgi:tRNA threonylcarbamoyladenosine biosynthesis protein TsaB